MEGTQTTLFIKLSSNYNFFASFEWHYNDGIVYTGEVTSRYLATSATVATSGTSGTNGMPVLMVCRY